MTRRVQLHTTGVTEGLSTVLKLQRDLFFALCVGNVAKVQKALFPDAVNIPMIDDYYIRRVDCFISCFGSIGREIYKIEVRMFDKTADPLFTIRAAWKADGSLEGKGLYMRIDQKG